MTNNKQWQRLFGDGNAIEATNEEVARLLNKAIDVLPKLNKGQSFKLSELFVALDEKQNYESLIAGDKIILGNKFSFRIETECKDDFVIMRSRPKVYKKIR